MPSYSLPDSVTTKDGVVLAHRSHSCTRPMGDLREAARRQGLRYRTVRVLGRNLRGKDDLHGRPYEGSEWLFTDKPLKFPNG